MGKDKTALILQHAEHEGPGFFRDILKEMRWTQVTVELDKKGTLPDDPSHFNLLLIMGGPMNVDEVDEYPFLGREVEFIANGLRLGIPMVGICLGSQLIAKAAGARVYKGLKKEIGWYNVDLTSDGKVDPHLAGFDAVFPVFQWHGDTFDLPQGAVRLATSRPCSNQAFRLGESVYAFQFHLEVTLDMINKWLEESKDDPAVQEEISPESVVREASFRLPPMHALARKFFASYLRAI